MLSYEPDAEPFLRVFVALNVSDMVRREIIRAQDRLKRMGSHVSWVPPENIHLSLEFIGDISRDILPNVMCCLDEAGAAMSSFSLEIHGIGSFGRPGSPRVIWAGTRASDPLNTLQARVHKGLTDLGLPLEERPFRPHLTIGRIRSSRGRKDLAAALVPLEDTPFSRCEMSSVALMQSKLRPSGPEYTPLHRVPFGG